MFRFTDIQEEVINYDGDTLLVSASAGTGKTTVMIERIANLIEKGADVSQLMVVTFTELAAAEMKSRLTARLGQYRNNDHIAEQLDKIDSARICTLHAFCNNLVHNYFYVADVDPNFSILDNGTLTSLKAAVFEDVFKEYFDSDDEVFGKLHKILSSKRNEENFRQTLMSVYAKLKCLADADAWYAEKRKNFLNTAQDNDIKNALLEKIAQAVRNQIAQVKALIQKSLDCGLIDFVSGKNKASGFDDALLRLRNIDLSSFETAFEGALAFSYNNTLPRNQTDSGKTCNNVSIEKELEVRELFNFAKDQWKKELAPFGFANETTSELWKRTADTVEILDKLMEVLKKFDEGFFEAKKQRGGFDFNDLEHLALKVLQNEEVLNEVRTRYKLIFVDEYQDTNPVQEEIVSRIVTEKTKLFMVGDIKQSIYRFRGCDPTIFLKKYRSLRKDQVKELNENFRSNKEILQYVNEVFDVIMTNGFGQVDYAGTARLMGNGPKPLKTDSVTVSLVVNNKQTAIPEGVYDPTAQQEEIEGVTQGNTIASKISRYVGMNYFDKDGKARVLSYGDIVILVRAVNNDETVAIYNTLVSKNIPVTANFKTVGFENKEVRNIITLLRAVDNPYDDIHMVGTCLSAFGGFCENDLAQIKIATGFTAIPFYTRLQQYVASGKNDVLSDKIDTLIAFLDKIRFYSHSATVDEVVLEVLKEKNYHLYVQGLPNGAMRLRSMYSFIDSLKGASYAQSIDRFLAYLEEPEEARPDTTSSANAVRILSMHASKGLEFPVVIIASANGNFATKVNDSKVLCCNEVGLALQSYDFDGRRRFDNLGICACKIVNSRNHKEEMMRLLYVAMTRAKMALEIVGCVNGVCEGGVLDVEKTVKNIPVKKSASDATSFLDWILFATLQSCGTLDEAVKSGKIVLVTQTPPVVEKKEDDLILFSDISEEQVLSQLNYTYQFQDQLELPSKIVSSALDRDFLDVNPDMAEKPLAEDDDRNAVGTAYHKVFQYVDINADKQDIMSVIEGLVNEGKVLPQHAEVLKENWSVIHKTLNNAQLRQLMSQGTVYHELPFMLILDDDAQFDGKRYGDGVMLQGVVDLLILGQNKATVVDFKYSMRSPQSLRTHYRAQMDSYRYAVKKIYGVETVDCYILSIESGALLKM